MIELIGGKLNQWDTGRKVKVSLDGKNVGEVHFSTVADELALVVLPYELNGNIVANIPNILLQNKWDLCVYIVSTVEDGESTVERRKFPIASRQRPEDYIYTETEVLNYTYLDERLKHLEGEGLSEAVEEYLKKNPVEAGATKEEAAQIKKNKEDIEKLVTNMVDNDQLLNAVNDALEQAKTNGDFKGDPGDDYVLTDADKQEIAEMVEVPEGGHVTEEQIAKAVESYLEENPAGVNFETNDTLTLKDGILSVNTTDQMEQDNTLPITSAGVYATVGNIEALLKTI